MSFSKNIKNIVSGAIVFSLISSLFLIEVSANPSEKRNIIYYGDWSAGENHGNFYPKDIPLDKYTHLNYAFLDFDKEGSLDFTDFGIAVSGENSGKYGFNVEILTSILKLRLENKNLKIGISVGGWNKSGDFSQMAASDTYRNNFVNNIIKFVNYTDMDFIDIDWEFPNDFRYADLVESEEDEGNVYAGSSDKENYIKLLTDIREELNKLSVQNGKTYELSVAIPMQQEKLKKGFDLKGVFDIVDFANVMTYDACGAWSEFTGHHSPLYGNPSDPYYNKGYSIDQTVEYLIQNGAPSEKIVIGAAFYSRGWAKVDSKTNQVNNPGLFLSAQPFSKDGNGMPSRGAANEYPLKVGDGGRSAGIWSYRNFDKLKSEYPNLVEYWDNVSMAPYMYDSVTGAFFTYDNERSVVEKAKYVNEHNLGGMVNWMAAYDKPSSSESTKRDTIANVIFNRFYPNGKIPEKNQTFSKLDISVNVEALESKFKLTITNNEKLIETDAVLKVIEEKYKTIQLPKLYIGNKEKNISFSRLGTNVDDKYLINLSHENKIILPGESVEIEIFCKDSSKPIESITIVQGFYSENENLFSQCIYGTEEEILFEDYDPMANPRTGVSISINFVFLGIAALLSKKRK